MRYNIKNPSRVIEDVRIFIEENGYFPRAGTGTYEKQLGSRFMNMVRSARNNKVSDVTLEAIKSIIPDGDIFHSRSEMNELLQRGKEGYNKIPGTRIQKEGFLIPWESMIDISTYNDLTFVHMKEKYSYMNDLFCSDEFMNNTLLSFLHVEKKDRFIDLIRAVFPNVKKELFMLYCSMLTYLRNTNDNVKILQNLKLQRSRYDMKNVLVNLIYNKDTDTVLEITRFEKNIEAYLWILNVTLKDKRVQDDLYLFTRYWGIGKDKGDTISELADSYEISKDDVRVKLKDTISYLFRSKKFLDFVLYSKGKRFTELNVKEKNYNKYQDWFQHDCSVF